MLFCRNAAKTLRRSIDSLTNQTYRNFEYVVQDAASTDQTLEILKEFEGRLDIRLVSEPDNGPADGFFRALRRCKGDIIATCLADEELLPDALERAVRIFGERPYIGAITGDAYITDGAGQIQSVYKSSTFSFAKYLSAEYCPYWSSSFFCASALRTVGLLESRWSPDSLEFEIWCRLAEDYEIVYVPEVFSKYGIHEGQLSNQGRRALVELNSRLQIIREHVFRPGGLLGDNESWRDRCILLQQINLLQHLLAYNSPEAVQLQNQIKQSGLLEEFLHARKGIPINGLDGQPAYAALARSALGSAGFAYSLLLFYRRVVPRSIRARISATQKEQLKRFLGLPRVI